MKRTPTPPRRFRFDLRTLFVLMTVVAVVTAIACDFPGLFALVGGASLGCLVSKVMGLRETAAMALGAMVALLVLLYLGLPGFQ